MIGALRSLAVSGTHRFAIALLGLALCSLAFAQDTKTSIVAFTLDFPQSIPDHYSLSVSSDGHAEYNSTGKLTPDSEPPDPFHLEFTMSPATRQRVFDLAAKAKYFDGKIDSGKRNIASTGKKVLTYRDAQRSTQAEYNYSPIPAVQELTTLFQNISTTLEFGRRLAYYHHYQKLALDDELKRMEEMTREKNLDEIQAVSPILQQIATDQSVINVARARAQRLLALSGVAISK
jgi:hypothetical protein